MKLILRILAASWTLALFGASTDLLVLDQILTTTEVFPTRSVMPRAQRIPPITLPQQSIIRVSGETVAPRDAVFRHLEVDTLTVKKEIDVADIHVTGTIYSGPIVATGPISAPRLTLTDPLPASDSDKLLAINNAGNVTKTTVPVSLLTHATSGNVPNTLVLRDNLGSFSTQVVRTQGLDVVGTSTFHDYIYKPFEAVSPQNVLYVHKGVLTAPNQFNSVKAAVGSIVGSGPTNPFIVSIAPGIYTEDTITMQPYVALIGPTEDSVIIQVDAPSKDVIIGCDSAFLKCLTLSGATDAGKAAVVLDGGAFALQNINFDSSDILIKIRATINPSFVTLTVGQVLDTAVFSMGIDIQGTSLPCGAAITALEWSPSVPMGAGTTFLNMTGPGAFFNGTTLGIGSPFIPPSGAGTKFLQLSNGATFQLGSALIQGFDTAFSLPAAIFGPRLDLLGVIGANNTVDISVQDQQTVGSISGEFARSKVVVAHAVTGLSVSIMEPSAGGITMVGPLFTGRDISVTTNISPLINDGASLGTIGSSLLYTTTSSFVVTVSAGNGYLMNSAAIPGNPNNLAFIEWVTTTTILPPNHDNFLYVTSNGQLQSSLSQSSAFMTIPLGKVRTGNVGALFIEQINQEADHTATQLTDSFIESLGPIYVSGSTTRKNGDVGLEVTSGTYVYGTHTFAPVGSSSLSWQAYLGAGTNEFLTTQTSVDWQQFDNSGALDLIPTGSYAKHLLYVVGGFDSVTGATNEQYALVYSQTIFTSLPAAVAGPVSVPPATWTGNIVQIAAIIVQNNPGTPSARIAQILDQRPRLGFVPSSVAGTSVHGNLLGLSADDHPQYLLVNGARAMSGPLNMGANQITNAGQINGVTIEAHAPRHLPGSVFDDPLPMGVPVTIETTNQLSKSGGVVNNFAYSDHVHAHGNLIGGGLHALVTTVTAGFMSNTDYITLTSATSVNVPNAIVKRDASGNFAAGVITLNGGSAAAPALNFSSNISTGLFSQDSSQIGVSVDGTQSLSLDTSGNVALGAGASTPAISRAVALGYLATTTQTGAIVLGRVDPEVKVGIGTVAPFAQLTVAGSLKLMGSVGTGSAPAAMFVQGNYAYVMRSSSPSVLQIIDLSNPASPALKGSVSGFGLGPVAIYVQGGYAYEQNAGSGNMYIVDVRSPSNPAIVSTITTGAGAQSVCVQGRYAYAVNAGAFALQVFDVSNPAIPALVGTRALVGFNSPVWVTVQDNYAYVTQTTGNILQILDVSNPTNPTLAGSIAVGGAPKGVTVQGRYAYVVLSTSPGRLQIVDVSNPNSPTLAGSVGTGGNGSQQVAVQGRYAYVVNNTSSTFQAIDVSNPNSPFLVPGGNIGTGGTGANSFFVQGRYAYIINGTSATLQVIDLGGVYAQQLEAGGIECGTLVTRSNVTLRNDLTVLGGQTIGKNLNVAGFITANNNTTGTAAINSPLRLVNMPAALTTNNFLAADSSGYVTQSTQPVSLLANATSSNVVNTIVKRDSGGRFATTAVTLNAGTLASTSINQVTDPNTGVYFPALDQVALVAGGSQKMVATTNGVGIGTLTPFTQLTVGERLTFTGRVSAGRNVKSVYVQGRYAYVACYDDNILQIIDVSNATNPVVVGSVGTDAGPQSVYVQGRYAYVINNSARTLQVIDVSDQSNPVSIGNVSTGSSPYAVYVQGRYAYVVNYSASTLQVIEISDPRNPVVVGSVVTQAGPQAVYVQGRYAYIVNFDARTMQIMDVSIPTSPVEVGRVGVGRGPCSIYVQGAYAYLVDHDDNLLQVMDVRDPHNPFEAGNVVTLAGPKTVYVQGRYAYVIDDGDNLLEVFDVSDPGRPSEVDKVEVDKTPTSLFVQGRYAVIVSVADNTLQMYDLGGAYIQQLETGGIESGTLATRENVAVGNDLDVKGGATIGRNLEVNGHITAYTTGTLSSANSPLRLVNIPQATTTLLYIDANGYVTKDASSRRFKENIAPLASEQDLLYTLTPVKFDFKSDFSGRKNMYGFIAEDLANVYPSLINYDAHGEPHDYVAPALHALEIKALQQQRQQIQSLLVTVASLQAQINTLHQRA